MMALQQRRADPVNGKGDKEDQTDDNTINSESSVTKRMTVAGGFLDVALFVADVEHLKFIMDSGKDDIEYYDLLLGLLFTSLTLQILIGVLLFVVGFSDVSTQTPTEAKWTRILNHVVIGIVSLIAIVNIFITSFGDRGGAMTRFRARHHCDSDPIHYNTTGTVFRL